MTGEPEGTLTYASEAYAPGIENSARINATLLALVRNEELPGMLSSMRDLERTWNHKFNYPWTFFNDVPFTDEFKRRTAAATKAEVRYEVIPKEHWDMPSWINKDLYHESTKMLKENGIQYADKVSYHSMCRWNSGMFYKHPALATTRYYWRVEPKVHFFCDVDYDVFRYMHDNNKTYGFTINLYDAPKSIPSLWPETMKFLAQNPSYLHQNNALHWLTDRLRRPEHTKEANGYSTCHFWSNFEIGDMDFWRSKPYEDYFDHLDRAGGFFYERWGDAPVHSIALGLFEDASRLHWWDPCLFFFFFFWYHGTHTAQVPRHWLPAHTLLQLPQLAQMPGLQGRQVHGRRELAAPGGLQAQLVQVCRHGLSGLSTWCDAASLFFSFFFVILRVYQLGLRFSGVPAF